MSRANPARCPWAGFLLYGFFSGALVPIQIITRS
jgi:hypothetical protein